MHGVLISRTRFMQVSLGVSRLRNINWIEERRAASLIENRHLKYQNQNMLFIVNFKRSKNIRNKYCKSKYEASVSETLVLFY